MWFKKVHRNEEKCSGIIILSIPYSDGEFFRLSTIRINSRTCRHVFKSTTIQHCIDVIKSYYILLNERGKMNEMEQFRRFSRDLLKKIVKFHETLAYFRIWCIELVSYLGFGGGGCAAANQKHFICYYW